MVGRPKPKLHWFNLLLGVSIGVVVLLVVSYQLLPPTPTVALQSLLEGDTFELLSLDPMQEKKGADGEWIPIKGEYHGFQVLGRTLVTDATVRSRLCDALESGMRGNPGSPAACFSPRHGIRVTHQGTVTDFVICFECSQVEVWQREVSVQRFLTSREPEATFDEVLSEAGVVLAPKSH